MALSVVWPALLYVIHEINFNSFLAYSYFEPWPVFIGLLLSLYQHLHKKSYVFNPSQLQGKIAGKDSVHFQCIFLFLYQVRRESEPFKAVVFNRGVRVTPGVREDTLRFSFL
jgi:hypothetical protein